MKIFEENTVLSAHREPKTDYTYSKSKSYSNVTQNTSCRSPNMSRRNLHQGDLSGYRDSPGQTPTCTHWLRSREIYSTSSSQESNGSFSSYHTESFQAEPFDGFLSFTTERQEYEERHRQEEQQRQEVERQRKQEQQEQEQQQQQQSYLFNVDSSSKESYKKSHIDTKTILTVKNTVTEIYDDETDRHVEKGIKEANLSKGSLRKEMTYTSGDYTKEGTLGSGDYTREGSHRSGDYTREGSYGSGDCGDYTNEIITKQVTTNNTYDFTDSGDVSAGHRSSGYYSSKKRRNSNRGVAAGVAVGVGGVVGGGGSTRDYYSETTVVNSTNTNIFKSSSQFLKSKLAAAAASVMTGLTSIGGIFRKEQTTNVRHMYGLDSDSELEYNNDTDRYIEKPKHFHYTRSKSLRRHEKDFDTLSAHHKNSQPSVISRCVTSVVEWFDLYDTSSQTKGKRYRRVCCCCLPLLLLFLLPLLLAAFLPLAGIAEKNSTHFINRYFILPFYVNKTQEPSPAPIIYNVVNLTLEKRINELMVLLQVTQDQQKSQLNRADVELIVKELLSGKIAGLTGDIHQQKLETTAKMEQLKLSQTQTVNQRISPLIAEAKSLGLELLALKSGLESNGADHEQTEAKISRLNTVLNNVLLELGQLKDFQSTYLNLFKNCCKNATAFQSAVREEVYAALVKTLGNNQDGSQSDSTNSQILAAWLHNNYISRSEVEQQLRVLTETLTARLNAMLSKEQVNKTVYLDGVTSGVTASFVRSLVDEALIKFSADKTGLADFALESGGGSVISTRCSETYTKKTALVSMFGIPLFYKSNSPRTAIQPDVNPGECWAFKGSTGVLVIQLSRMVRITAFSMEHIPKSIAPYGQIDSAPKDFSVYSLKDLNDQEGMNLGNYTYRDNGRPLQQFPVQMQDLSPTPLVEVRISSNYGNLEFTCLYRFRIHGVPEN